MFNFSLREWSRRHSSLLLELVDGGKHAKALIHPKIRICEGEYVGSERLDEQL